MKLKDVLKELTDRNFKAPNEDNSGNAKKILQKVGFKKSVQSNRAAKDRIYNFGGGTMFVHIQYHELETKLGKLRLHQTQYWLREKDVNTTLVTVRDEDKRIGSMLVDTDIFLSELKRVNVTKRVS